MFERILDRIALRLWERIQPRVMRLVVKETAKELQLPAVLLGLEKGLLRLIERKVLPSERADLLVADLIRSALNTPEVWRRMYGVNGGSCRFNVSREPESVDAARERIEACGLQVVKMGSDDWFAAISHSPHEWFFTGDYQAGEPLFASMPKEHRWPTVKRISEVKIGPGFPVGFQPWLCVLGREKSSRPTEG